MFSSLNATHYMIAGSVLVIALLIGFRHYSTSQPGQYDEFAQCIADSGATFYGAYWCPHCAAQKDMFGASAKLLPYKECSLPNAQGQTQECTDAGVKTYPTWEFADGSRLEGTQTFATLAEATSCALPTEG